MGAARGGLFGSNTDVREGVEGDTADTAVQVEHLTSVDVVGPRARQLARGADSRLPWGNHKSTVLSLREIAEGLTDRGVLEEAELPAVQQPKMELEALDPSFDA